MPNSVPTGPSTALSDRLAGVDPTVVQRDQLQRSASPGAGRSTLIDGLDQFVSSLLGRSAQALVTLLVTLSVPKGHSLTLPDRLAGVDPTVVQRDQLQRSASPGAER